MRKTAEQIFEQWIDKKEKNPENYEIITIRKEQAVHNADKVIAKAINGGVKGFKNNQLVVEEEFFKNSSNITIILKKLKELVLWRQEDDCYVYFGSKEKLLESEDIMDELLLYFNDTQSGMLLQAKKGKDLCYLINVGDGAEGELLKDLWYYYKRNVVANDEK